MGLYAAIILLSPLIHEGEQQYKPYVVGDSRMVSLLTHTHTHTHTPWRILATTLCCGLFGAAFSIPVMTPFRIYKPSDNPFGRWGL